MVIGIEKLTDGVVGAVSLHRPDLHEATSKVGDAIKKMLEGASMFGDLFFITMPNLSHPSKP